MRRLDEMALVVVPDSIEARRKLIKSQRGKVVIVNHGYDLETSSHLGVVRRCGEKAYSMGDCPTCSYSYYDLLDLMIDSSDPKNRLALSRGKIIKR